LDEEKIHLIVCLDLMKHKKDQVGIFITCQIQLLFFNYDQISHYNGFTALSSTFLLFDSVSGIHQHELRVVDT